MLQSGAVLDLSSITRPKIDKHSTGGVGDKVSLILAPLVAILGVAVPMMSGRGLGHTGGTVDKLESIPGFSTDLSLEQFYKQLDALGCALITQTDGDRSARQEAVCAARCDRHRRIAAADRVQHHEQENRRGHRRAGAGHQARQWCVPAGPGSRLALARTMIGIGKAHGRDVVALVTAMDRPLGYAVGNALEMEERIFTLRGDGPADLHELTVALAVEMLELGRGGQPKRCEQRWKPRWRTVARSSRCAR